ncbi:MAG: peptidylprolyl isomerase [Euryarchaeota archaeon]|nr:peptidylprolyl isomerase [Euryarchaeota archaeon]
MKLWVYVTVLLVIMVGVSAGIYVYNAHTYSTSKSVPVVEEGDKISVRYYGYIYYGGERRVFDTNIEKVAVDNLTYPKTVTYKWPGKFDLLTFTVGSGTMIKGFDLGVRGMKLGETKTIVVPPDEGYPFDWNKVKNESTYQTVPVIENLTLDQFYNRFAHTNPDINSVWKDKWYGWNVIVLYVSGEKNIVTIQNNPDVGKDYEPFGDPSFIMHVNAIKNGKIYVHYIIKSIPILLPNGGIIDKVWDDHFRINYNKEVAGKTLYFVVTVVDIKSS